MEAFCGSHKSKDEKDLDEAEHKEILESILPSSSSTTLDFFADTLDLEVVTKVNVYAHVIIQTHNHMSIINIHFSNYF